MTRATLAGVLRRQPVGAARRRARAHPGAGHARGRQRNAHLTGVPPELADGGADSRGGLSYASGQLGRWDGDSWECAAEADPVYAASAAAGVTGADVDQWRSAYAWGDHASAGYLTAETDPDFDAWAAAGIGSGDIDSWNATAGHFDGADLPADASISATRVDAWNATNAFWGSDATLTSSVFINATSGQLALSGNGDGGQDWAVRANGENFQLVEAEDADKVYVEIVDDTSITMSVDGMTDTMSLNAAGDLQVSGDVTPGGIVTCPTTTTRVGPYCISDVQSPATHYNAATACWNMGMKLCSVDALAACDILAPSGADCTTWTDDPGTGSGGGYNGGDWEPLWTERVELNDQGYTTTTGEAQTYSATGNNVANEVDFASRTNLYSSFCCLERR